MKVLYLVYLYQFSYKHYLVQGIWCTFVQTKQSNSSARILCLRRRWKNVAGAILHLDLSVCEWVHEWVCVPQKPYEHHISETSEGKFTQFWSQMYLGSYCS